MPIALEDVERFLMNITPNKNFLYVIQPCSIGDFLYSGGLSYAVQKRKNKNATVFIVNERMKNLGITYENFADIIYLEYKAINILGQYLCATQKYEGDNYIYGHFRLARGGGGYDWDNSLHFINRYKINVFDIPINTPLNLPIVEPPTAEKIYALHKKIFCDRERTIILCPYANSIPNLPIIFWEILTKILLSKGYIVYTNVDGRSEKPIVNTNPITTSFGELLYLSDKVKCFIGLRSGIFDFLAMTKAKIFYVAPFPSWADTLDIIQPSCDSKVFFDAVSYLSPIMDRLQKDKVVIQLKLFHENINDSDIYYSYENILSGIVNAVDKL